MWDIVTHIIQWLNTPIDTTRPHTIEPYIAWHARMMVVAWGVLLPVGIIIARFFKITPKQHFPKILDNRFWWHSHIILQTLGGVLAVFAWVYILYFGRQRTIPIHEILGWITMTGLVIQLLLGQYRGVSGGPTYGKNAGIRGDHYDMTRWRYIFEYTHKYLGYILIILSWITGATGMWTVNAPLWMWGGLGGWLCLLMGIFAYLQYRGYAVDTYEAIWGMDRLHPGNQKRVIPFGVRRLRLEHEGKVQKKPHHINILGRPPTETPPANTPPANTPPADTPRVYCIRGYSIKGYFVKKSFKKSEKM